MQSPVGFNISNLVKPTAKPSTSVRSEKKSQAADLFGQKGGEESTEKELNLSSAAPQAATNVSSSAPAKTSERGSSPTEFKSALSNKTESPVRNISKKSAEPVVSDDAVQTDDDVTASPLQISNVTIAAIKPDHQIAKIQADAVEHKDAMTDFLGEMKEKLGISAEDVLVAFKSLSKEELAAPPEQNINKMVQSLGLNPQQALVATQLFKQLLVKTDAKPDVQPSPMRAGAGLEMAMFSPKALEPQTGAKQLNQMSNSFFMKATPKVETQDKNLLGAPLAKADVEATDQEGEEPSKGFEIPEEMTAATPVELSKEEIEAVKARVVQMKTEPKKVEAKAQASVMDAQDAPVAAAIATEAPTTSTPKGMEKLAAAVPSENMTTPAAQTATPAVAQAAFTIPSFAKPGSGNSERGPSDDDKSADIGATGDDQSAASAAFVAPTATTTKEVQAQKLDGAQMPMAAHELVQHAQVMVKDGGGEMKVTLRPDGLGEVSMKVAVKDGKVTVQLVTQSDDAKQVLERSFKGLKESLSAHHLNLDSIKVDTASNMGQSLDRQMKDAQQEQSKQQARQFFEQFNQDNGSRNRAMFDIPGAEVYRSQQQTRPVGQAGAYASSMASRRLDLVA